MLRVCSVLGRKTVCCLLFAFRQPMVLALACCFRCLPGARPDFSQNNLAVMFCLRRSLLMILTVIFATASVYGQLTRDADSAGWSCPLEGVRAAVSGAEGLPPKLVPRIRDVLGTEIMVGYGLTEAFQFVLVGPAQAGVPGACGRPVPGFEARIVDKDGHTVGPDVIGTLQIRGKTVLSSYWHKEGREQFEGEWFTTRDRFLIDRSGEYFHCGRVDDLFKVGGKWGITSRARACLTRTRGGVGVCCHWRR